MATGNRPAQGEDKGESTERSRIKKMVFQPDPQKVTWCDEKPDPEPVPYSIFEFHAAEANTKEV